MPTEVVKLDRVLRTMWRARDLLRSMIEDQEQLLSERAAGEWFSTELGVITESLRDEASRIDLVSLRAIEVDAWMERKAMHPTSPNIALRQHADAQIARLRSLSRRELKIMDALVYRFVLDEMSPTFGGDQALPLFEHWLGRLTFRCQGCADEYLVPTVEPRGRPRRFCSAACRQAAYRQRTKVGVSNAPRSRGLEDQHLNV